MRGTINRLEYHDLEFGIYPQNRRNLTGINSADVSDFLKNFFVVVI